MKLHPGRAAARLRTLVPLGACLLLAACPLVSGPSARYELTFTGHVRRSDTGAAVPGAHVMVWLGLEEDRGVAPPFVEGQTDEAGAFRLSRDVHLGGAPRSSTFRVTPPAGSGLQPASDEFESVTGSDRRYVFSADVVLQVDPESGL